MAGRGQREHADHIGTSLEPRWTFTCASQAGRAGGAHGALLNVQDVGVVNVLKVDEVQADVP